VLIVQSISWYSFRNTWCLGRLTVPKSHFWNSQNAEVLAWRLKQAYLHITVLRFDARSWTYSYNHEKHEKLWQVIQCYPIEDPFKREGSSFTYEKSFHMWTTFLKFTKDLCPWHLCSVMCSVFGRVKNPLELPNFFVTVCDKYFPDYEICTSWWGNAK
jgi:hypothetical protein